MNLYRSFAEFTQNKRSVKIKSNVRSNVVFNQSFFVTKCTFAVADPGFPVGGRAPVRGGVDLRRGCFSVKMYAKTKELGPRSANDLVMHFIAEFDCVLVLTTESTNSAKLNCL